MQINPRSPEVKSRTSGRGRRPPTSAADPPAANSATVMSDAAKRREQAIAQAAYFLAERDGFPAGRETEYWLSAESDVDKAAAKQTRE
jgi:hypothetical protein